MNDEELLSRLDARAGSAVTALYRAVDQVPIPASPSGAVKGHDSHRILLLAAALVVLVGAVGAVVLVRHNSGTPGVSHVSSAQVRPYQAAPGYRLGIAARTDAGSAIGLTTTLTWYGPSDDFLTATQGRLRTGLAILVIPGVPPDLGNTSLTVRGRPASYSEDIAGHSLAFNLGHERVSLQSPDLTQDVLVRIASSIAPNDARARIDEATLPKGWRRVAQDNAWPMSATWGVLRSGPGATALGYTAASGTALTVATGPGGAGDLASLRRAMTNPRDLQVRGHSAVSGTIRLRSGGGNALARDRLSMYVLAWQERPGEIIQVSAQQQIQPSDDLTSQLRQFAEKLRPASQAELARLLDQAPPQTKPDPNQPGQVSPGFQPTPTTR